MGRSYYLDDFLDESVPCELTLEGWAAWLSKPDPDWEHEVPKHGEVFTGSAIAWSEDIVATRADGTWSLSREPAERDFVAVRFGKGLGWSGENIVTADMAIRDGKYVPTETMAEALVRWFREYDDCCDDVEYVAVGQNEDGWRFTYHSAPQPHLVAERTQ